MTVRYGSCLQKVSVDVKICVRISLHMEFKSKKNISRANRLNLIYIGYNFITDFLHVDSLPVETQNSRVETVSKNSSRFA